MDLSDLLVENTSSSKVKTKKGDFIGAIQKSISGTNIMNNINEESSETKSLYKGIEIDDDVDTFKKETNKNFEDNKLYAKSEGNFFPARNIERLERRSTAVFSSTDKKDETITFENLLNRRKSVNLAGLQFNENNRQKLEENIINRKESNTGSNTEINQISKIIQIKSIDNVDEELSNIYIPTINKNSRRSRLGGNLANISENISRGSSQEKKEDVISFRDKNEIFDDAQNQNKNLLKNSKNIFENEDNYNKQSLIEIDNKFGVKNFSKSLSFGLDNEINNFNVKDITNLVNHKQITYEPEITKTNSDNDQIDIQQGMKFDEEKSRFESLLKDEREKYKRKEDDYNKFIEELKQRYKEELKSNEEKNKSIINSLNDDVKKLKIEIENEISKEKEHMRILHQSDMEKQENIFQKNFENQKKFYDEQNETLKKQLQQQIEFNKLANRVELSSKQIEEILQKYHQDKDKIDEIEKESLYSREKYLKEKEEKIKENEKNFVLEKETLLKMRNDIEIRDLEKRKELQDERMRIEKEILRLQELQNSLKFLEFNAKEKYEKERLELNQKHSQMKIECDSLKNDFNQRLSDLEYSKKILEEEKKFFEKYKEEANKNIDIKKANLEDRKKQFYEEEREIKTRIKILQEKEYYLNEKFEEFDRAKSDIDDLRKIVEKDRVELITSAKRIDEGIKILDEKNRIFEKEREELFKRFQEFENEKSAVNSEKLKIEQTKSELRLRLQSVDMLRIKYVSNNIGPSLPINDIKIFESPFQVNPSTSMTNNFLRNTNFNNNSENKFSLINKPNSNDLRQSKTLSTSSNLRKSFNADDYMASVKLKFVEKEKDFSHNFNSNFNNFIQQEKEYLRNSKENLENSFKKDYERTSKNFNNNFSDTAKNNSYKNDILLNKLKEETEKVVNSQLITHNDANKGINIKKTLSSNEFNPIQKLNKVVQQQNIKSSLDDYEEIIGSDYMTPNINKKSVNYDDEFE